jgi:signal peptidase II|tara:strand:- start:2 stop:499 length:498 start_codon:yes stop_codon:yes gene_type:complete
MNISKNLWIKIFSKEITISLILISIIFALDRVSKISIIKAQSSNSSLFINDYLNLELVWNTGIGFGLLSHNANIYYHGISFLILFVIFFLIYIINKVGFFEKILYSLILGGALGNFFDRVIYYAVPDFIDFHIHDFHWFTFNIADIFITIGVILLITKDLILNKK